MAVPPFGWLRAAADASSLCRSVARRRLAFRARAGELGEAARPLHALGRGVPRAEAQPVAAAAQPGPRHVHFKNDGALDPAAVPADDVQDSPRAAGWRTDPDDRQLAPALAGEQAAAEDAVEVSGGRGVA